MMLTLTDLRCRSYLRVLRDHGPMTACEFGWEEWGKVQSAPQRPQDYARAAGKILRRLERDRLAVPSVALIDRKQRVMWRITPEGKALLRRRV